MQLIRQRHSLQESNACTCNWLRHTQPWDNESEIVMNTEIIHAKQVGDHKPTAAMIDNKTHRDQYT